MAATVTLFDPATGIRIDCIDEYSATNPDDDSIYIWTDGNYSCDCNRRLFMGRADAKGYPTGVEDTACGDVAADGRVLFGAS